MNGLAAVEAGVLIFFSSRRRHTGCLGDWSSDVCSSDLTWPDELRAKAIAIVQSSWAIGYALAALVAGIVLRYANWRMVFFVGILPALVTLWIRKGVPESEMWTEH